MLLTITYTPTRASPASDLGYLLHKNPARPQTVPLNFGKAHIFYPDISPERCAAALLLDIDPLDLARGKEGGGRSAGLFDYVNDRPYVSSSFMSTAISQAYGTAMAGRCDKRQELADAALDLAAEITALPCRGSPDLIERIFAPLGYETAFTVEPLDEHFPEWGASHCVNLSLRGRVRLRDLLRHLYVLIPVFDLRKHYWVDSAEVDKLLAHGEGWLETHPAKELIIRRYLKKAPRYARIALDRLDNGESGALSSAALNSAPLAEDAPDDARSLNQTRLSAVLNALKESGAQSVIDLGCGEGRLLSLLAQEKTFTRIAGTDVSPAALARAADRLGFDPRAQPPSQDGRFALFQSSVTYRDARFAGYDAAALVEVVEHLDAGRLDALLDSVFIHAAPKTIVLTTPNREYNAKYAHIAAGKLRHEDHRFEWTREEFRQWAEAAAARTGYTVTIRGIGEPDERLGAPTQMAVFSRIQPSR